MAFARVRRFASLSFLLLAASAFALTLWSADRPLRAQAAVNLPTGQLLSSNCLQCHSVTGNSRGFEDLRGETANEIYSDLIEFQSGKEGQGLMAKHAMGYTDQELRAIAAHIATLR